MRDATAEAQPVGDEIDGKSKSHDSFLIPSTHVVQVITTVARWKCCPRSSSPAFASQYASRLNSMVDRHLSRIAAQRSAPTHTVGQIRMPLLTTSSSAVELPVWLSQPVSLKTHPLASLSLELEVTMRKPSEISVPYRHTRHSMLGQTRMIPTQSIGVLSRSRNLSSKSIPQYIDNWSHFLAGCRWS